MAIKEVPIFEAKTRLSELLAAVERGEQVTITRRGIAVARLVAAASPRRQAASQRQRVSRPSRNCAGSAPASRSTRR